jgi:hypothetical protein
MPEVLKDDMFEDLGKASKGLTALKEVWGFASRVAALQQQYAGKAIPIDKLFGAMLGFGDKPNPLEYVEKQLAEINAKLDRVLAGIEELKIGQLGQGVLAAYLDMSDPVYLIEKYFQDLAAYQEGGQPWTEAERKEFVEKVLGTHSERDSVAFSAHKIVKLSPVTQTPLLFDLLFPYLSAGATAANARQVYVRGAFALRSVAETLSKGLILESFALASAGGDPAKVTARVKKATEKYRGWVKAMLENSFLPFAERIATLNFKDEYLGGHDTSIDAHLNRDGWKPAKPSILQSADDLAAKLMGKSRGVTLRVIPNVPPIADKIPSRDTSGAVSAGTYQWEVKQRPQTSLTKENLLGKMEPGGKQFFEIYLGAGKPSSPAESVSKVEVSFADGAAVPIGFDRKRLSFLRYQFDFGALPDDFQFTFNADVYRRDFPLLDTKWQRVYIEDGHRFPGNEQAITYSLVTGSSFPGYFKLPSEGQLSPVLVTYAYSRFGPAPS